MNSSRMVTKKEDTTIKTFRIKRKYVKMLEKEAMEEGITVSSVLDIVLKRWNSPEKSKIRYIR